MGVTMAAVEEREVESGRGTPRGGSVAVEDVRTLLPGRPKAPPSFVMSVGVGRPGAAVTFVYPE